MVPPTIADDDCVPVLEVEFAGYPVMANGIADKLDLLMVVFFQHLRRVTHREGGLGNPIGKARDSPFCPPRCP